MNVREAIQDIVNDKLRSDTIRVATVISVEGDTCTVSMGGSDTEVEGVRLQMDGSSGVLYTPAEGSTVLLAKISDFDFAVIMFSELSEVKFLDGSFGGLTKTKELKTQLDKSNEVLQLIAQALTTWTPVSNDGGAALKAAVTAALAGKAVGNFSNIENENVTHGL